MLEITEEERILNKVRTQLKQLLKENNDLLADIDCKLGNYHEPIRHDSVKTLALVLAKQAEVEGMKVANFVRVCKEEEITYTEADFIDVSEQLVELVKDL